MLQRAVRDGWKQEDNKRFGQCLEIRFIDTVTNKVLFRYAPLLTDEQFFLETFGVLREYDELHKKIFSLVQQIDGERFATFSECSRTWCKECGTTINAEKGIIHKDGCSLKK